VAYNINGKYGTSRVGELVVKYGPGLNRGLGTPPLVMRPYPDRFPSRSWDFLVGNKKGGSKEPK